MSDIYELAIRQQTTPRAQTSKTTDVPKARGRIKANADVLGAGPEVILNAVPKGRTAQIDEAIATNLRSDEGFGGALQTWGDGLGAAATAYGTNRDVVAELYIEHGTKSPGGTVDHILHAQRKAALSADYNAYATLAVEAQNAAVLSGPTFWVIELADKSHKELMAALVASGHAKQDKGRLIVDGARVQAESLFHLQAEEDGHIESRSAAMADASRGVDLAHEDIGDALFGANAATAKLRSRAFLQSASKDQHELKRQNELLDLCGFVDQVLGGLGQLTGLHGEVVKGMDGAMTSPKAAIAGGGLVARFARWITGDEIGHLQRRIEAKRGLAGMEDYRGDFEVIQGQLGSLDKALRRFAAETQITDRKKKDHRDARTRAGGRMDTAARGRAELAPRDELHVPMADRLARVESAAAFNEQAQKAVSRLLAKLLSPASNVEVLLSGTTNQSDLKALRLELPRGNLFRVMIQNLMAVRDEFGNRATILEGVKVQ